MRKKIIFFIIIYIIILCSGTIYARDVTDIVWPGIDMSSDEVKIENEGTSSVDKSIEPSTESLKNMIPSAPSCILPSPVESYKYGLSAEALTGGYGATANMERYIVELRFDVRDEDLAILRELGCEIEVYVFNMVQVLIPVDKVEIVRHLHFIKFLRSPFSDIEENSKIFKQFASTGGEEFSSLQLNEAHKKGYMGQGVKIAILDTAFEPSNPVFRGNVYYTLSFRSHDKNIMAGDIDHGNAVTEIVTRIAPKTKIILVNFQTDVEYIKALKELINMTGSKKPDVIVTAVNIILPDDYYDGSGIRAGLARLARDKGITIVSSAGNNAQTHYMGNFNDTNGNSLNNFTSRDDTLEVDLKRGDRIRVVMSWKDNWNNPSADLDLGIFNDSLQPLAVSTIRQKGLKAPPYEMVDITASYSGAYHVAVKKIRAGDGIPFMIYIYSMTASNMEYFNPETSLDPGLPPASDTITVGSVQSTYPCKLEPWSSQGRTTDNRMKPDLVALGGIYCTSINSVFSGTSSSAPQVAGAIALLLSKNHGLSPDRLKDILKKTAHDLGPPGEDPVFGAGLLNIYKAMLVI